MTRSGSILWLAATVLSCAALAQPRAETKGRLEGVVVASTGEPIARAQVAFSSPDVTRVYSATTDETGRFTMTDVEPGRYGGLNARAMGFVRVFSYAAIQVAAGQKITGLRLTMEPASVISGRVTDPAGEPLQGASVKAMQRGYSGGRRILFMIGGAPTDDRGAFRMSDLPPGTYYLQAEAPDTHVLDAEQVPMPTQYAGAIQIVAGQRMEGLQIRIKTGRVFKARGKVVLPDGSPATGVRLMGPKGPLTNLSADGSFVLRGLSPGVHWFEAVYPNNRAGRFAVTVTDTDVEELVFRLTLPATITGTMRLDDGDLEALLPLYDEANAERAADQAQVTTVRGFTPQGVRPAVMLSAPVRLPIGILHPTPVLPGGEFSFRDAAPAEYQVSVLAVPDGLYVRSVRFGAEMEIVLAKNAATVAGTVRTKEGAALANHQIVLWSAEPEPGIVGDGIRMVSSDIDGAFRFPNLRPGLYYAAAWERTSTIGVEEARPFLDLLRGEAQRLDLKEGSRVTVPLVPLTSKVLQAADEMLP